MLLYSFMKYQNQFFNDTVHQLNQEPQVYLPPPPEPVGNFFPPPNNMFRGRGTWRHYHQNHFTYERNDRPYRRRRSHLDDIYLPNYEDNDDLNESDEVSNHRERFNNRGRSKWNVRHRVPQINRKKDSRHRCLISTKTSDDCAGDKEKSNDKLKNSASNTLCSVTKTIAQTNVAGDNSKKNVCDNDCPTDESDKVKCSNDSGGKDEETKVVVAKEDINESIKQTKVVAKISVVRDDDAIVVGQHETKTEARNSANVHSKPNTQVSSVTDTVNLKSSNAVNETPDSKQSKTGHQSATHKASSEGDSRLEDTFVDPFVVIDCHKSAKVCLSRTITTPVSDEQINGQGNALICHTLPSNFPTWEQSVSNYQNPFMSIWEIDSDEETVCYNFITVDSIDTTKTYFGVDHLDPELDDCRVVNMAMTTPSPTKRKDDEDYGDVTTKKTKYDRLYDDINSDQLLKEINDVLMEDKQNSENTTSRYHKRYRSKSLTVVQPKKDDVLPRCRSLYSIDQNHQVMYNFDVRTNLLELFGGRNTSPIENSVTDDSRCSNNCQSNIIKYTDRQKDNTIDAITERLHKEEKDPKTSHGDQVHKQKEKKNHVDQEKDVKIESVNGEAKEKIDDRKVDIDQLSKESETNKTEDEIKLVQTLAAAICSKEAGSKGESSNIGQTKNGRVEKSNQKEDKSLSNISVSRENVPKNNADLKNAKSHVSTDNRRNFGGSSVNTNAERRTSDETRKVPENKSPHTDDNQPGTRRCSDYKKSVGLAKKPAAPPEMSLPIGNPKKLTSKPMAFSNNAHYLKKLFDDLFGSEDDEMDDTHSDDRSDSKKRKYETDVAARKKEPQPKKLYSECNEQQMNKVKSLDKARRYSMPGSSICEGETPKSIEVTKSSLDRQSSNNTTQKSHNSAVINTLKQPNDPNQKISHKSKQIDKDKRRTSTSSTSSDFNKCVNDKRRISMALSSVAQVISTQKTRKPEDNKRKDKNSKQSREGNSTRHELKANTVQNGETSKNEQSWLNIDKGKSQSHGIDRNPKNLEKQIKSRTNPKVSIENIPKKCHKESRKDGKEGKAVDKNNKPVMLGLDNPPKERKGRENKDICENMTPKTTDGVQANEKQSPAIAQKQSSHSKDIINHPNNLPALQPQLVLYRIEDHIANTASQKQNKFSIKTAIDSFVSELNYLSCTTLDEKCFPMKRRICVSFTENECSDRAAILESPKFSDKTDTVKQQVTSPEEQKESSDDVIEIKPDIPVIDLTQDGIDIKDEPDSKPDKKDAADLKIDLLVENPKTTNSEETITLYRSDETLNNSLEVQAMVASISSQALRKNDSITIPDKINPNEERAEVAQNRTMPFVSTKAGVTRIPVLQETSMNNSKSLTDLLIEKAINDAISQRDQQISSVAITGPQLDTQTSLLGSARQSTPPSANQHDPTADSNISISSNRNQMAPHPNLPNPVVHSPRRENEVTTGSNQITLSLPYQTPRSTENSAVFTASQLNSPQYPITQVSFNTTQNAKTCRSADSYSPPVFFNHGTVNGAGIQNLNPLVPGSTCIENNSQGNFNTTVSSSATTENSTSTLNYFTVSQTQRDKEITSGQIHASGAQSSSSCNEPNIFVATSNLRGNQNVNEQRPVSLAPDGPLRGLQQLPDGLEQRIEVGNREASAIGLILIRYLYYFDGLKKAQMAYSEHLKKMSRCLPQLVRGELAQFDQSNFVKFCALCRGLVRDLRMIALKNCQFSRIQPILDSVYKSMKVEVPDLTKSWVYLMLETLIKPQLRQYLEVPFLAALYNHIKIIVTYIYNRTAAEVNPRVDQSLPVRDLFTSEQRRLLERQLLQYKTICTNQVILISMENSLQSNLLRAHQNNQLNKANQQNNAPSAMDIQLCRASVGSVPAQLYDITGPPNVSLLANNIPTVRTPPIPQQASTSLMPTTNSESLKNMLFSGTSSKNSAKRPSKASSTSKAAKTSNIGSPSRSSMAVLTDIAFNSTVTAPTPRPNQLEVPSNIFCPTPRAITKTSRRNSSPSKLQVKPISSSMGAEGTNDTFRIRLPFIMPYSVRSSPRASIVAQHSPHSAVENSFENPSMPSTAQNFVATPPRLPTAGATQSMPIPVQNAGATSSRSCTTQSLAATPYWVSMKHSSGATPSRSSMVQNSDATLSRPRTAQNSGATPRPQNSDATPSRLSMVQSGATPSGLSMVQNSGATPSMVQNTASSPSVSSMVQSTGTPHLSMPLLDENFPSLSHIQHVMQTLVYAPIPIIRPPLRNPSPPLEVNPQPSSSDEATLTAVTIEDKNATRTQEEDAPSVSEQTNDENGSHVVKNEGEQQFSGGIETIDLTWLDDVDLEQLQNEIEFIAVKKEEVVDDEIAEEGVVIQEPIGLALSPTDSGISSPNVQVEYNEQVFSNRTCICGKDAEYVCGCMTAMYCSDSCQLKDWKSHKDVCIKRNVKKDADKDANQNQ